MTRDYILMIFEAMLVASCVATGVVGYMVYVLLIFGHL